MILQRYVLRELLVTFSLTLVTLTLILFIGITAHQLHLYRGLGLAFLAEAMPFTVPFVLAISIPFAGVVAAALAYGRLAADREIDAVRACGIHLARVMAPGMLLGLFLTFFCLYLNHVLVPYCHLRKRELALRSVETFITSPAWGNHNISIGHCEFHYTSVEEGDFRGITFVQYDPETGRISELLFAEKCRFALDSDENCLVAEFRNGTGMKYTPDRKTGAMAEDAIIFEKYEEPLFLDKIIPESSKTLSNMTDDELFFSSRMQGWSKYQPHKLLTELYRRTSFSFAPLVLMLAAAPLGVLARPGGKLAGVGLAVLPMLVFYMLYALGQTLGLRGAVPPEVAMWGAPALLAALSLPFYDRIFTR
ncbi:MAG: LptF/LptG family permease [Planctomycetes bacterium]|nr:LptF/LptG family permease [Planctomycetota bacterium]